jgi:hypothetical protein
MNQASFSLSQCRGSTEESREMTKGPSTCNAAQRANDSRSVDDDPCFALCVVMTPVSTSQERSCCVNLHAVRCNSVIKVKHDC